jgi:hypothetical protein
MQKKNSTSQGNPRATRRANGGKVNLSDRVKVKDAASVDFIYRGRTGSVIADTVDGEPVEVEFDDQTVPHSFNPDEVELL